MYNYSYYLVIYKLFKISSTDYTHYGSYQGAITLIRATSNVTNAWFQMFLCQILY